MAKAGVAYIDVEGNFNPFQQGMSGLLSDLSNRFASFGSVGTRALAGVSLSAVAVGYGLVQVGKTFDQAFDTIRVGTGATGAALDGLKDDFKAVAKEVPAAFGDVATTIADVNTRLGLTGEPLRDVSARIIELTRLTGGDLSSNIAGITRLFGDWSVSTDDQADTLDKLFRASQSTGIGIDQLTSKVVFFGAPLRQLGFSFDEAIAMVSRFEKEGVNLETVLGGMRMGLARLAKAGEEPSQTFKRVVADIKALGDSGNIIESNARAMELFGARAGPDVAAAIREGRLELGSYIDTIANGKDTILGAAADTADFTQKWQLFKNRVLIAIEPIATKFFDLFNSSLDMALPLIGAVVAAFEPLAPVLAPVIAGFVGIAAAALPLALAAKGALKVAAAIKGIGTSLTALKGIMAANPWILALIAAAVVAILIIKNWSKIKAFFAKLWADVKRITGAAWDWIKAKTSAVWDTIRDLFRRFWPILVGIFTGGLGLLVVLIIRNWDKIKDTTTRVFNSIVDFVKAVPGRILAGLASLLGLIVGFFSNVWTTALNITRNLLEAVIGFVASIPGRILGALGALAGIVFGVFSSAMGAAINAVASGVGELLGFFASLPGRIVGALGDVGSLLFDIGRRILQGLIDGAKSILGDVKDFFSGVGNKIVGWKGPPPADAVMLKPAGRLIMEGLLAGAESELGAVKDFFGRRVVAAIGDVSVSTSSSVAGIAPAARQLDAGASRVIHLHIDGPITIRSEEDLVALQRGLAREVERQDRAQGKTVLR